MNVLQLSPEQNPWSLADLHTYGRVELHFTQFTDGRGYTQAHVIRQRLGFRGVLRATGAVLVDQVSHMARVGFNEIELREDQSLAAAHKAMSAFKSYYQDSAATPQLQMWVAAPAR
jgi:uncharacterized protein (DUF934 family)